MPQLIETYGDQGITGFLKLTGAINSGGSSDEVNWWEAGRRHKSFTYVIADTGTQTDLLLLWVLEMTALHLTFKRTM
jgi:hypothetical protein